MCEHLQPLMQATSARMYPFNQIRVRKKKASESRIIIHVHSRFISDHSRQAKRKTDFKGTGAGSTLRKICAKSAANLERDLWEN